MSMNVIRAGSHAACRDGISLLCKLAAASGIALAFSGCAVGPDFVKPQAPQVSGYTNMPLPDDTAAEDTIGGGAQHFVNNQDIPAQWWEVFQSQPLNALIEQALKANPNLQSAEAALRAAQESVYAQRGAYTPSVDANFSPSRQKTAGTLSSPLASGESIFNLHTAQLNVSYTIDAFGANRRQVEALQAQADYQRFQLEAAHLSLSSNVVATVVQMASLRAQIAATESTVQIIEEQLRLMRRQFELGAIPALNVTAQEATLAQTRAALPPLRKQLAQQQDLLAALTGRYPSEMAAIDFDLSALQLPQELPVSLPAKLVRQRPDVRAAEEQLHAASAQVGVAVASMFPQITLTGGVGSAAPTIAELFTSGAGFWSLTGGLTQPLFHGGALFHRKRAAEAAYEQAAGQYRGTVLSAFQNVADTLHALRFDAEALTDAFTAERATFRTLGIVRRQVELGDANYLSLLSAQQAYQQARINLVQAQANRYADTAALFQALGGGWWNRPDETAKD